MHRHAGLRFSGPCAAAAYSAVRGLVFKRILLFAPLHRSLSDRILLSGFSSLEVGGSSLRIDRELNLELMKSGEFLFLPAHEDLVEHSAEMQFPFLHECFNDLPIAIFYFGINWGGRGMRELQRLVAGQDQSLVVVSSDFCHWGESYGYTTVTPGLTPRQTIDSLNHEAFRAIQNVSAGEFLAHLEETGNTVCGKRPIECLLRLFGESAVSVKLLAYEKSDQNPRSPACPSVSYAAFLLSSA